MIWIMIASVALLALYGAGSLGYRALVSIASLPADRCAHPIEARTVEYKRCPGPEGVKRYRVLRCYCALCDTAFPLAGLLTHKKAIEVIGQEDEGLLREVTPKPESQK